MGEQAVTIAGLALGSFAIRLGGYLLGARLPATGPWERVLRALPGCLIAALLATILVQAGPTEWGAGAVSLAVALLSRSLPLTMVAGVGAACLLRALA